MLGARWRRLGLVLGIGGAEPLFLLLVADANGDRLAYDNVGNVLRFGGFFGGIEFSLGGVERRLGGLHLLGDGSRGFRHLRTFLHGSALCVSLGLFGRRFQGGRLQALFV